VITVDFKKGIPTAVNGKKMKPAQLLATLNKIAGAHGIGRVDIVENRFVGMKSRGVYETPGGTVLHIAHRAIESITLDRESAFLKESLMPQYARLVYFGFWFSPEREALQALVDKTQENVTGTVRLKLYKGNCIVTGRKSPCSLYDPKVTSFDVAGGYNQADATGFIKLNALRLKIDATRRKGKK
jgi:argininosuccinate synthase